MPVPADSVSTNLSAASTVSTSLGSLFHDFVIPGLVAIGSVFLAGHRSRISKLEAHSMTLALVEQELANQKTSTNQELHNLRSELAAYVKDSGENDQRLRTLEQSNARIEANVEAIKAMLERERR